MFGVGVGVRVGGSRFGGGGGFDPSAQAYIDALAADGYPLEAPEQTYINTLVTDFKSAGIWSKMKAIYPYCTSQRNLIGYSEDFGNASWTKSGATVTTNDILAPNGTLTADKVVFGGANNYISQPISALGFNLGNCNHSIYIKGTAGETVYFDDHYVSIPNVTLTGDWQRVDWTSNRGSGQYQGIGIGTYNSATARTIWLWGAQLELGSTATTYQPVATTASTIFASQFKYNLKDPRNLDAAFRQVFNGGWTYSKQGATPNGTNGYADTKLVPSSVLSVGNSSYSYYTRTDKSTSGGVVFGCASNTITYIPIIQNYLRFTTGNFIIDIGDYTNRASATNSVTKGMYVNTRTSTSTLKAFKNNSLLASNLTLDTSSTLPSVSLYLGGFNDNGSGGSYDIINYSFTSIGDGLSDSEASAMYTSVQSYQTSMQRQV